MDNQKFKFIISNDGVDDVEAISVYTQPHFEVKK